MEERWKESVVEQKRREEKRDDNSLIPPIPLSLHTFYTSFLTPRFNFFLSLEDSAEFAINDYSLCVVARAFFPLSASLGSRRKRVVSRKFQTHAPFPFPPFLTIDNSLYTTLFQKKKTRPRHDTTHAAHTLLMTMDMDRDMSKYASLLQTAKAEHDLGDLKVIYMQEEDPISSTESNAP